jgi:protein tyrosine phosphatase (PTP) superfamily phosphohydrolase (DUF442 family)
VHDFYSVRTLFKTVPNRPSPKRSRRFPRRGKSGLMTKLGRPWRSCRKLENHFKLLPRSADKEKVRRCFLIGALRKSNEDAVPSRGSMFCAQPKEESKGRHCKAPSSRARLVLGLAPAFILLVVAASPFLGSLGENFHLVIPGRVYRSGQLSPESLRERAAREGIRSVINLRGANPGQPWYDRECAATRRQDLTFYDLPVDSQCPTASELRELLDVLERCPKPVLVHCQSGIDRSGIVAAICILLLDDSGSIERARTQLSWRYGHMPWRDNMTVQESFLQDYENWLTDHGQDHDRGHFRDWLLSVSEHADVANASRASH